MPMKHNFHMRRKVRVSGVGAVQLAIQAKRSHRSKPRVVLWPNSGWGIAALSLSGATAGVANSSASSSGGAFVLTITLDNQFLALTSGLPSILFPHLLMWFSVKWFGSCERL